jgi:hypothetical protein
MQKALQQRRQHAEEIDSEIETKHNALSRLAEISTTLAQSEKLGLRSSAEEEAAARLEE